MSNYVLARKETLETYEYATIKTLKGVKLRPIGRGITSVSTIHFSDSKESIPKESDGHLVSENESAYSGTPYRIITRRYEK